MCLAVSWSSPHLYKSKSWVLFPVRGEMCQAEVWFESGHQGFVQHGCCWSGLFSSACRVIVLQVVKLTCFAWCESQGSVIWMLSEPCIWTRVYSQPPGDEKHAWRPCHDTVCENFMPWWDNLRGWNSCCFSLVCCYFSDRVALREAKQLLKTIQLTNGTPKSVSFQLHETL